MVRFACEVDHGGGATTVLRLRGALDLTASPVLGFCISGLVSSGHYDLVIDARDVSYVDHAGLRTIAREARHLKDQGGSLVVRNAPADWRSLFEMLSISQLATLDDVPA